MKKRLISILLFLAVNQSLFLLALICYQAAEPAPQLGGPQAPPSRLSAEVSYSTLPDAVTAEAVSFTYAALTEDASDDVPDQEDGSEIEVSPAPGYAEVEVSPAVTLEDIRAITFQDVSNQDERADYISYAVYQNILNGVSTASFNPEGFVTRAELVTVLYRMSGESAPVYSGAFSDVSSENWYSEAVSWAVQAGVAAGTSNTQFSPSQQITREQLAAFLHRFAAFSDGTAYDVSLSAYQDGAFVSEYARLPLAWALENRLYGGMVSDTIHPNLPVSRGQLAQVLVALTAYSSQEPLAQELTGQLRVEAVESVSVAHHDEIQEKVNTVASKYRAVGLQVAVVESGQVTDAYTYGWAIKDSQPMTPEHKLRTTSITKVGVGLAAMILLEDGVIDLDESIGTYWGFPVWNRSHPDNPINIRALLSHTSSIPVLDDDTSRSRGSVEARLRSGGFTKGVPGSIGYWNYNNYAFGVLGMTLEIASGRLLDDIMEERLWSVMEIDAAFESGNLHNTDLLATIYTYGGGVGRSAASLADNKGNATPGSSGAYFAGGLTTSAVDLAKMAALLANDGRYEGLQLLRADTVDLMEQRYDRQLPDGTYQALPLRSQDNIYGRDKLYYHTGSSYGLYNWMSYDPDTGDGVVVLSSGASGAKDSRNIYAVCGDIGSYIYDVLSQQE